MLGEHEEQMGCLGMKEPLFFQVEEVPVPEWVIEQSFCETDKAVVVNEELIKWADEVILPLTRDHLELQSLVICANHVHIGPGGLTPHDHLPHAFTSVLYLVDAEGPLVIHDQHDRHHRVYPREGRLVIFSARLLHHVEPSPADELRISFVSNYEFPSL